jgi:hypothetical protein
MAAVAVQRLIDNDFLWGKSSSLEMDYQYRPRIAYTFGTPDRPDFTRNFASLF